MSALSGRRLLLTRRPEQAGALAERLRGEGADVVEIAAIAMAPPADLGPLDAALGRLHLYDWILFTSVNAVTAVADRLTALGVAATPVGRGTAAASVGAATSEAFRERFPEGQLSLQPERAFRASALLEAFRARGVRGQRFVLPASDLARETLAEGLREDGAQVDVVVAYRTVAPDDLPSRIAAALTEGIDMALFASPSAVVNFAKAAGAGAKGLPAAVIGPVTREAALRNGLDVRVIAEPSTAEGLVRSLVGHYRSTA